MPRPNWHRVAVISAILLASALFAVAVRHNRIWSWRDWQIYQAMSHECHPVWRDLYDGRVHEGQGLESVIAATKPVRVERLEEFTTLHYQEGLSFSGVWITAHRSRLVSARAASCTWTFTFFNHTTEQERRQMWLAHARHVARLPGRPQPADCGAPPVVASD